MTNGINVRGLEVRTLRGRACHTDYEMLTDGNDVLFWFKLPNAKAQKLLNEILWRITSYSLSLAYGGNGRVEALKLERAIDRAVMHGGMGMSVQALLPMCDGYKKQQEHKNHDEQNPL